MNNLIDILNLLKDKSEQEIYQLLLRNYIAPDFDHAFEKSKVVLCVSPHPDDCDVGVGGLIAKYSGSVETYYVIVTDGSKGTKRKDMDPHELAIIRKKEQEEAAKILCVKEIFWLGYVDGEIDYRDYRRIMLDLIHIYRLIKPDIVLTPDPSLPYEAHLDHIIVGKATSSAAIFSVMPLFNKLDQVSGLEPHRVKYVGYYYTSKPNYYVDITSVIDKKLEALNKHVSQFGDSWNYIETLIRVLSFVYGRKIGVQYGEAIKLVPTLLLHAVPFTEYI